MPFTIKYDVSCRFLVDVLPQSEEVPSILNLHLLNHFQLNTADLCSSLFPLALHLATDTHPYFPKPSSPSPNSRKLLGSTRFPRSVPQSGNPLQVVNRGKCGAHHFCFPSLRDHCPSLSEVQCLESHCLTYFIFFDYFRKEVKSSILVGSRHLCLNFHSFTLVSNESHSCLPYQWSSWPWHLLSPFVSLDWLKKNYGLGIRNI